MFPNEIVHIYEPNPLACGQAVLAMLSGKSIEEIFLLCGTQRETTLKCMKNVLKVSGMMLSGERREICFASELPSVALLSLETPKCWHWSLYFNGKFYDPEYGVLDDFPECKRKYCWEIKNIGW